MARTFNDTAGTLERQVGELRRMESDARRFVADVSHELRTPLAAMTAVTDVLDEEADHLPGTPRRAARLVSQETQNLTQLVNDLIEVSRFDSGTAGSPWTTWTSAAAVTATLRARGWPDRVRTELPPGVVARLDPRRLDVIVANLVGNALRHGAEPVSVRLDADSGLDHDRGGRRRAGAGPGGAAARLRPLLQGRHRADPLRGQRPRPRHRLGERAPAPPRRRRGSLVAANGPGGGAVFTLRLPRDTADTGGAR